MSGFVFNWGQKSRKCYEAKNDRCPNCGAPFAIFMVYKYFGLFSIFLTSWGKGYAYGCDGCSILFLLAGDGKKEAEDWVSRVGKSPIPFHHRWGLWLFLVCVMGFGGYTDYSDIRVGKKSENNGMAHKHRGRSECLREECKA